MFQAGFTSINQLGVVGGSEYIYIYIHGVYIYYIYTFQAIFGELFKDGSLNKPIFVPGPQGGDIS